jgi:hypothetical protein
VSNKTHVDLGRLADWLLNKDGWSGLLRHMAMFENLPSEKAYFKIFPSGVTDMRYVKAVQLDTTEQ